MLPVQPALQINHHALLPLRVHAELAWKVLLLCVTVRCWACPPWSDHQPLSVTERADVWEKPGERTCKGVRVKEPHFGDLEQTAVWHPTALRFCRLPGCEGVSECAYKPTCTTSRTQTGLDAIRPMINYSKTGKNRNVPSRPLPLPLRTLPVEIEIGLIGGRPETAH